MAKRTSPEKGRRDAAILNGALPGHSSQAPFRRSKGPCARLKPSSAACCKPPARSETKLVLRHAAAAGACSHLFDTIEKKNETPNRKQPFACVEMFWIASDVRRCSGADVER